ncbi:MAG: MutT/nudix family protein, probable [Parcubacteria group bacterium GW2011_GWA2_56_7]|nr:MAG: MutT/nudix family protein, probable [Parcubacteria group bacterium GW2011_GWA2_56_7]
MSDQTPKVGAGVVIIKDGMTLLTKMNMLKEGKHYLDVSFTAEIVSGEPTIMEPHRIEEVSWHPLDHLPTPLFPPVAAVLDALRTGKVYHEVRE